MHEIALDVMKYNSLGVYLAALLLSSVCRVPGRQDFERRQCSRSVFISVQPCPFLTDGLKQHLGAK